MSVGSTELTDERRRPAVPAPGAGMSVGSTELTDERRRPALPAPGAGMRPVTLKRRMDDLLLQLKGLVHVRALLEVRGASARELKAHSDEIRRVRAELARLTEARGTGGAG